MKKLLAIILAVVMTCTLVFAVSAADETLEATGAADQDVNVTVEVEVLETVYHVDITWGNLTFVYKTTKDDWNPGTHDYDTIEKGWINSTATIEIVNHSNTGITVEKSYVADEENAAKGSWSRASGCGPEGRGFESHYSPHNRRGAIAPLFFVMG